jgi:hypothetical protein
MFELLLQTFWAKKKHVKSLLISNLDKVNLLHWKHFYRALQNLSSLHKIGLRPAEKKSPVFFNMRVLDLDFYGGDAIQVFG